MALFGYPYLFAAVMVVATGMAIYEFFQTRKLEKTHSRRGSPYREARPTGGSPNHVYISRTSPTPSTRNDDFTKCTRVKSNELETKTADLAEVKQSTRNAEKIDQENCVNEHILDLPPVKEFALKSQLSNNDSSELASESEAKTADVAGVKLSCSNSEKIDTTEFFDEYLLELAPPTNEFALASQSSIDDSSKSSNEPETKTADAANEKQNTRNSKKIHPEEFFNEHLELESQPSNEDSSESKSRNEFASELQSSKENVSEPQTNQVHESETGFRKEHVLEQYDIRREIVAPDQQDEFDCGKHSIGSSFGTKSPIQLTPVKQENLLCICCDKPTTTVVSPCNHPYTCIECAELLFRQYDKCVVCRNKINSYHSV